MRILSGDYLFSTPQTDPSAYFLALTIGFGVLFVVSALAFWRRGKLAPANPVLRRVIRRASKTGMWGAAIGLFFCVMRYIKLDYLAMPFWMLLTILGLIAAVAYFVYDLSERYPLAVHRLQESSLERRFRPAVKARPEPPKARATNRPRGKRRR